MSVVPSAEVVERRLREASRLVQALDPAGRLDCKLDMTATGVAGRLQQASDLLELCRSLSYSANCNPTRAERP